MEEILCIENTAIRLSEVVCLKHMAHDNSVKIWFKTSSEPVTAYGCTKEEYERLLSNWKEYLSNSNAVKKVS